MKNSGLFIGLGIGLLIGAAIGLYIATDDERKAELMNDFKKKADDAKNSIEKIVKKGLEELDKAVEVVTQTTKDTISKISAKSDPEVESV